jgi:hypothetical protein
MYFASCGFELCLNLDSEGFVLVESSSTLDLELEYGASCGFELPVCLNLGAGPQALLGPLEGTELRLRVGFTALPCHCCQWAPLGWRQLQTYHWHWQDVFC